MNAKVIHPVYSWKRVLPELGFLLPGLILGLIFPILSLTFVLVGIGTIIIVGGIFFLIVGLYLARVYGLVEVIRLRAAGYTGIELPRWSQPRGKGFWRGCVAICTGINYWRAFAFSTLSLLVAPITATIALVWVIVTISFPVFLFTSWIPGFSSLGQDIYVSLSPEYQTGVLSSPFLIDAGIYLLASVVFGAALPLITTGLTLAHFWLAKRLLTRTRSDRLIEANQELEASRSAAISAEGRTLRSLERDIHDGPQQQLLRLQMDLAAAERKIQDDPQAAKELLSSARALSRETLSDLRRLSRGIAPPLLQDKGLYYALESLRERNTAPTIIEYNLPHHARFEPALEQNIYFIVSELFVNAMKHTHAEINAQINLDKDEYLVINVNDSGTGGATVIPGHGLAGITQRTQAFGGTMDIDSPTGGPTAITVRVPAIME